MWPLKRKSSPPTSAADIEVVGGKRCHVWQDELRTSVCTRRSKLRGLSLTLTALEYVESVLAKRPYLWIAICLWFVQSATTSNASIISLAGTAIHWVPHNKLRAGLVTGLTSEASTTPLMHLGGTFDISPQKNS